MHEGVVKQNISISFIQHVLNETSENSLLSQANDNGDTPLHVAVRFGHTEAVQEFLNRAEVDIDGLLNKANSSNNTALHDAARGGYADIVELLVKAGGKIENDLQHLPNNLCETPLFLAAERGWTESLRIIIEHTGGTGLRHKGPCGQTSLHIAVLHGNQEIINQIMQQDESSSLIRLKNDKGQTPLHCCAWNVKIQNTILRVLLSYDNEYNSAAYIQDNEGQTPLHIAASDLNFIGIRMLIDHCPDCIEMIDNKGQNVMHYAAKTGRLGTFRLLLEKKYKCEKLRNEKDNDGNTPLHILAAVIRPTSIDYWRIPKFIREYKKMDVMAFNNNILTAGDIIEHIVTGSQRRIFNILPWGRRKNNGDPKTEDIERGETLNSVGAKERQKERLSNLQKSSATWLVVATLIATVSFTAGFTVPGGFDQSPGKNMGMAVLVKKTAFVAFLISDTIAFTFSSLTIMFCFSLAGAKDLSVTNRTSITAIMLTIYSLGALMIAFVTGVYAVVSPSLGVAVIIISLIFFDFYLSAQVGILGMIWLMVTV